MAELAAADVERYTRGRLPEGDPETIRLLAAGLAAARRFCGWHVTPVKTGDVVDIDGPGGLLLVLPTLKLEAVTALTEDSVDIDVDNDLYVSKRGLVTKKSGAWWSCNLGAIEVTMTHGYDEAPDFDAAVLSWIDRMSLGPVGGRASVIGPFQFTDDPSVAERALLEQYRLEFMP